MTAKHDEPHVGLVVEGAGDVQGVPILLRAHMRNVGDYRDLLGKPVPFHGKGNATAANGVEGYVTTAALRPGCVGVLVVLDSDDDCVAIQGPQLRARAQSVTGKPVAVAIAERNYEDWLYSSVESLHLGAAVTYDPAKRGISVISEVLAPRKYVKPTWQPRLTSRMNLSLAKGRSTSLNRMIERFDQLRSLVP